MDNFNYQAYLKSGKIYGESKLLTEEVSQSKPNKSTLKENSIRLDNQILSTLTDLVEYHTATSGLTDEEAVMEMMEFLGQKYDVAFEFGRMMQEEAEVNEIGMFMDPIGYETSPPEKETFTKKYVSPGIYDIFKHGEKIATIKGEGEANAYINTLTRELMEDDYLQEEKSLEDELLDDLNETAIFEAEEDVDVDVDVEDEVDIDVEEEDDIEIEKTPVKAKIEIGLTPEEEAVQDSLQAAMEASRDLDNSTLTDQIGNTITYFTRQFVVGDTTD